MELIKDFLEQSKTFSGFQFRGLYLMPLNDLCYFLKHYQDTGENLLDDYSSLLYNLWNSEKQEYYKVIINDDEYQKAKSILCHPKLVCFFETQEINKISNYIEKCHNNHIEYISYPSRRLRASLFTTNPINRKKVFSKYGRKCLVCGSEKNIQLDHIVAVKNGGEDIIENMQPLCKSCNIKKGTTYSDHRKNG